MPAKGYNINLADLGDKYEEAQLSAIKAGADMHLVMTVPQNGVNGSGEIQEVSRWQTAVAPARLLWRTYSTHEGDWIRMLGYTTIEDMWRDNDTAFTERCRLWANEQAARWNREGLPDVIRDDPANEPGLDASNRALNERYVIRCVELQNACNFFNVKVAIGAFSVGTPHEDMIASGVFDPILRIANYFSVHEYPAGLPGAGDLFPYEDLLEPETYWQKLPQEVWETEAKYWLLRRCDRLYLRAKELGNSIEIIVSESNTSEDIPDAVHVNNALKARGLALSECGGDLRGHQAWRLYYEKVFNSSDFQKNLATITEYQVMNVWNRPYIIGDCTFTLGFSWGTGSRGRYRCHNYLGDDCYEFRHTYLPAINVKFAGIKQEPTMPEPIPEYRMERKTISSRGETNIRVNASASAEVYLTLRAEDQDVILAMISNIPVLNNDGYGWHKIRYNDRDLWVAKTNNLLITDSPVDIPAPEPEPAPDIEQLVQAEVEKQLAHHFELVELDLPLSGTTTRIPRALLSHFTELCRLVELHAGELRKSSMRADGKTPIEDLDITFDAQASPVSFDDTGNITISGLPDNEPGEPILDTILNNENKKGA